MSGEPSQAADAGDPAPAPRWLQPLLLGLVGLLALYRALYHFAFLELDPFAVAPVSDGRVYLEAAADLLAHPPLGREPFWLQGAYAVQLAVPMAWGGLALALLLQLALAAFALWWLHRALRRSYGTTVATLASALLLGYAALAFYENKILSASLAVVCSIAVVTTFLSAQARPGLRAAAWCGVAAGLALLARPNLALAIPTTALALALLRRRASSSVAPALASFGLGLVLALAPMALRNLVVTGSPSVLPVHGGGTSFYIGNNAQARGVWNAAGVLSGDVTREREELGVDVAGVSAAEATARSQALGRALYTRAWQEIADDPGRWLWLELRKAWLLVGNDELAQDYDPWGERELIPWAWPVSVPFGVFAALALVGVAIERRDRAARPRLWCLGGLVAATVLANLVFFTSSQHRLPLVVPLAPWAALGTLASARWLRHAIATRTLPRRGRVVAALAVLVALQAAWPRTRVRTPSAVHYYNLGIAYDRVGELRPALHAFDRALELRPDHPVMRIERASVRVMANDFAGAQQDLALLREQPEAPAWVRARAAQLEHQLRPATPDQRPAP